MQRTMLKSKIHRATVTASDLHYVGSCSSISAASSSSGSSFETYTIAGAPGSGEVKVNGAAARLVHTGDTVIVISYAAYDAADLERYEPRVVHVEAATNRIIAVDDAVAALLS